MDHLGGVILKKLEEKGVMNTEYTDVFNEKKQNLMRDFFLSRLGTMGEVEKYERGTTICKDILKDLYIVKDGRVNISLNEAGGEEQLVYNLVAGEILGEFEILSGIGKNYLLHFVEDTELWRVSKEKVDKILREDTSIYSYFIHSMTRKYNLALYQVTYNRFYSSEERIIEFFLRMARSRYPDIEKGVRIEGYTHGDIGNNINISRVGVTNLLKRLKSLELIEIRRKCVVIVSVKKLFEYREKIRTS